VNLRKLVGIITKKYKDKSGGGTRRNSSNGVVDVQKAMQVTDAIKGHH
jgi:hypothetical protein